MKKISTFLATFMFAMAIMTSFGNMQEVNAFAPSEVNYQDYTWYDSAKAGTAMYFYCSLDYATADSVDVTGWKAALCPENNITLDGAVATFDVSPSNKFINHDYGYASVGVSAVLASDIPEGYYKQVFFDAAGNIVYEEYSASPYVNKTLVTFSCVTMNNDGYAYAYVYSENPAINASTYPTFYAADKTTALTTFVDYTTTQSDYGDTVHFYKLEILDASQFALDQTDRAYPYTSLYYKVGTPIVPISNTTVSGNDVSGNNAGITIYNDGGVAPTCCDANGFHYTDVFNLNDYVAVHNEMYPDWGWTVTNPFDQPVSGGSSNGSNNSSNNNSSNVSDGSFATIGDRRVVVSVTPLGESTDPNIQAAIDNLKNWVSASKDAVKNLNKYAPAMKVKSVVAAGTMEVAIGSGVDLSAGVPITFSDSSIKANVKVGDKIIVLHVKHDGSIEYLPAVAGDGTITATFTSLSPVAWFKVNTGAGGDGLSPKTGQSFWDFLINLFF